VSSPISDALGRDAWAQWLLYRRHGGDPAALQRTLDFLSPIRDRVLANARIAVGETVLDVGCGDGLIAFGALPQVGEGGTVIFGDVSQDLLDHARALASDMGFAARCRFVLASADDLSAIPQARVDVVTTRSVLIYVADKERALAEFFRVLRPGGRISLFEPINRFSYPEPPNRLAGNDVTSVADLAEKVRAVQEGAQFPACDPMLDFDERDLLTFAERVGFREVHLELRAEIRPADPRAWETVIRQTGNPHALTYEEAVRLALTPAEARQLEDHLRPLIEVGCGTKRSAVAYLWATKHLPT
jgi:arsenite methyltransferase